MSEQWQVEGNDGTAVQWSFASSGDGTQNEHRWGVEAVERRWCRGGEVDGKENALWYLQWSLEGKQYD